MSSRQLDIWNYSGHYWLEISICELLIYIFGSQTLAYLSSWFFLLLLKEKSQRECKEIKSRHQDNQYLRNDQRKLTRGVRDWERIEFQGEMANRVVNIQQSGQIKWGLERALNLAMVGSHWQSLPGKFQQWGGGQRLGMKAAIAALLLQGVWL